MRKLVALAAGAAVVWRVVAHRHKAPEPRVVIGYGDGSIATLEPGSPDRKLLVDAATEALRA